MKQTKKDLTSFIKSLNALTQKIEKMIDRIESAKKHQAQPKKTAVPKKAIKKTAESSKAPSTKKPSKKPAKKAPTKSPQTKAPEQISDSVLGIIQSAPDGVTTDQIIEKTDLNKKQVWGVISKAKRAGKIASPRRGIYTPSQS